MCCHLALPDIKTAQPVPRGALWAACSSPSCPTAIMGREDAMNIAVLTNEYPPHVYGGAGVHVEYLTRELARLDGSAHTVRVLCFGDQHEHLGNLHVDGV